MRMGIAALLCALACTSVHMVQRDGCWLKRTEKTMGGDKEELGFCTKPAPQPAEDRMSRLVQECMAQADYRWENRAIAAWSRGEPIPPQDSDDVIAKTCMSQASAALGIEAENSALRQRLAELTQDRDTLRGREDEHRQYLEQTADKMVTALGEAAKKPAPNATATATSTTKTESDTTPASTPALTVVNGAPAPAVMAPRRAAAPAGNACSLKLHKAVAENECATKPPETAKAP